MSPRAKVHAAQVGIPVAVLIAVFGVLVHNWFVVIGMVLLVIGQVVNYSANRDRVT